MMKANYRRSAWSVATMGLAGLLTATTFLPMAPVQAQLIVDFDGGDTSPYSVTSTSGDFSPTIMSGGPTGNFMRLVDLTGSNNNSVAFDEVAGATGPAPLGKTLTWDFRMSSDEDNTAAGGCCESAADGFGIGYFAAAAYGAAGPSNPAADVGAAWERPAIPSAAVIGFDVYPNIDEVSLNFGGTERASVDVSAMGLDLNNNTFHRGIFVVRPDPADSTKSFFSIDVIEDVYGASPVEHKVLDDFPMDFDLGTIGPNRVISGGRTGGAFVNVDLDNISVFIVPEPSSLTLSGIATLGLLMSRRRRRS